jgi:hypothetical protein
MLSEFHQEELWCNTEEEWREDRHQAKGAEISQKKRRQESFFIQ